MERFGLDWIGKERSKLSAQDEAQSTLVALDSKADSDDLCSFAQDSHEIIEGDNLEALRYLRDRHTEVDLIYIDPPYNTGNDFIYSDHARLPQDQREEEAYRSLNPRERSHCAWLSMMNSRLIIARDLLSERGSIWLSIDDHEQAHLQSLLLEIFGEENHIATIITCLNPKGRQLGRFAINHEYLLVFAKNIDSCELQYATQEAVNPRDFRYQDEHGRYRYLPLRNSNKRFNPETRPTLYYPLYVNPKNGEVSESKARNWHEVYPVFGSGEPAVWRWSKKKVSEQKSQLEGSIIKGRLGPRWDVRQKDYCSEERTKKLKSVWRSEEIGSTDEAAREIKELGLGLFETPKPTRLLKRILSLTPKDSIVLDFFAGSGTTGDATIRQNKSDGGERRFILIESEQEIDDDRFQTICGITRSRIQSVKSKLNSRVSIRSWRSVRS